jgi:hypothetical protein
MKLVARRLAWLLPLLLSACVHNTKQQAQMQPLAPPIEDTPPPPPDLAPNALPAPVYSIPKTPEPVAVPPQPEKPAPKHHKSGNKGGTGSPENGASGQQNTQMAEAAPPAEVSALGNFATPEAPDSKKQTESSIADIEKGLNGIGRKLSDQEEKTSMQIKEFLKQARTALASGDIEGAKTLAIKAKALLGELSQ